MVDQAPVNPLSPSDPGKPSLRDDALAVVRRLRDAGHVAYFAGGCVRDLLLGRPPKDYDVATDAPPQRVRALFPSTQAVGAAFGVILVRHRRSQIEVATFRSDGAYLDGRRPEGVRFTTAEEDAKRRDFTINGLFLDPLESGVKSGAEPDVGGRVIDYVGGREDMRRGLVRAIGDPDARFEEDHLRLLRAVRFAARLGFEVEAATRDAIGRHAGRLARISPERVGEELRGMLTPPTRVRAWRLLGDYRLDDVFYRSLKLQGVAADPVEGRGHFFDRLAPGRTVGFGSALAAATLEYVWRRLPTGTDPRPLFERAAVLRMKDALRYSLKISNEDSDQVQGVQGTLEGLAPLLRDEPPTVAVLKRFLDRPAAPLSRELLEAFDGVVDPARRDWLRGRLAELEKTEYAPPPLISGDDLTAAGLAPGPVYKKVLEQVYDEQLEGRVGTKAEALGLALGWARELKL